MKKLLLLIAIPLLFAGCYNQQKAVKQMEKGIRSYEDTARTIFRSKFPCITVNVDSSAYKAAMQRIDSILTSNSKVDKKKDSIRISYLRDSIKNALKGYDCPELLSQSSEWIARLEEDNQRLRLDSIGWKQERRDILKYVNSLPPVKEQVKDSSEVKDALVLQVRAEKERNLAIAERDHYKKLWDGEQERRKGAIFVWYIKWWWLLIGMAIGGIVAKWKGIATVFKKIFSFLRF